MAQRMQIVPGIMIPLKTGISFAWHVVLRDPTDSAMKASVSTASSTHCSTASKGATRKTRIPSSTLMGSSTWPATDVVQIQILPSFDFLSILIKVLGCEFSNLGDRSGFRLQTIATVSPGESILLSCCPTFMCCVLTHYPFHLSFFFVLCSFLSFKDRSSSNLLGIAYHRHLCACSDTSIINPRME